MSNQCRFCEHHGNMDACDKERDCSIKESWYVGELALGHLKVQHAASVKIRTLERALFQISQAPFPLHDYCNTDVWEFACNLVNARKEVSDE